MMALMVWTCFLISAVAISIGVILTTRQPMNELLKSNSYIQPARKFYLRSFSIMIFLAALGTIFAVGSPCKTQSENFVECIWWISDNLASVFWGAIFCLGGYALLLTVLFVALGRYHDK